MQLLRRRASSLAPLHLPRMLQIQPCRKGRPCLTCAERPPASAVNPALQGDAQTPSSIKAGTPCQRTACQCAAVQLRPAVATLLSPAAAAQCFWQPRHRAALTFLSPQSSQSSLLLLLLAAPRPLRLCELPLRAAIPPVGRQAAASVAAAGGWHRVGLALCLRPNLLAEVLQQQAPPVKQHMLLHPSAGQLIEAAHASSLCLPSGRPLATNWCSLNTAAQQAGRKPGQQHGKT